MLRRVSWDIDLYDHGTLGVRECQRGGEDRGNQKSDPYGIQNDKDEVSK